MRQVSVVVALLMALGCGGSSDAPPGPDGCAGNVIITTGAELIAFAARGGTAVSGTLTIGGTDLTSLHLSALTAVGGYLEITSNPALPQCLAMALKDHLVTEHGWTGSWTITGNDTTAICR